MVYGLRLPKDGPRRFLYDIWQPLTLFLLALSFTASFFSSQKTDMLPDKFFCNADGRVEVQEQSLGSDTTYEPFWDPKLFFTINLAFGNFSFTAAKLIDACWDAVIGRGGQLLVAWMAYNVLRRSFTLIMESCAVPISTTTSFCCSRIQLESAWRCLMLILGRPNKNLHPHSARWNGKLRLTAHALVFSYALAFATLSSVMTGYSPQLTGYFDYKENKPSSLKPLQEVRNPLMTLVNGSRLGLGDVPMLFGGQESFYTVNLGDYLSTTHDLKEPYGTLFDYYWTCRALMQYVLDRRYSVAPIAGATVSLKCADHECSCESSIDPEGSTRSDPRLRTTSNITLDGRTWQLSAPPLDIHFGGREYIPIDRPPLLKPDEINRADSSVIWQNYTLNNYDWSHDMIGNTVAPRLAFEDVEYNAKFIKETGVCIAAEAYTWGFSSLLLLTWCVYTIIFAGTLILLQTDVYWNSRSDRDYPYHNIYHDVLFLANELHARFGSGISTLPAEAVAKTIKANGRDQGIRIIGNGLPPSRFQEWRRSRAAKAIIRSEARVDGEQRTASELPSLRFRERLHIRPVRSSTPNSDPEELRLVEGSSQEQPR